MNDLISRQAAIDALCHVDEYNGRSVEAIRNLPSAQPKIKLGDAVRVIMEFLNTCSGRTAWVETPDGVTLETDWGYVEEGLKLLEEYAERKTDG